MSADPDWHTITGEYPPQLGGVGDYTRLLCCQLAAAGDRVHVWTATCSRPAPSDPGVSVHRLPGHFGPRALARLDSALGRSADKLLLVQYVPQAFGWKSMNLPFCLWLLSRRRDRIWVIFHEVAVQFDWRQSPPLNLLAGITRLMAILVARAAERIFVTTPMWEQLLKSLTRPRSRIQSLSVPSNIPVVEDLCATAAIRKNYIPNGGFLIGSFATYSDEAVDSFRTVLPALLNDCPNRSVLLLGRNSERLLNLLRADHPQLAARTHATGFLDSVEVSKHLRACDLMIQPYAAGVTCRHTSVMASLAHGLPLLTTKGRLTEPLWSDSEAVVLIPEHDSMAMARMADHLLRSDDERLRLSAAAKDLYQKRFDIKHTIAALREAKCASR